MARVGVVCRTRHSEESCFQFLHPDCLECDLWDRSTAGTRKARFEFFERDLSPRSHPKPTFFVTFLWFETCTQEEVLPRDTFSDWKLIWVPFFVLTSGREATFFCSPRREEACTLLFFSDFVSFLFSFSCPVAFDPVFPLLFSFSHVLLLLFSFFFLLCLFGKEMGERGGRRKMGFFPDFLGETKSTCPELMGHNSRARVAVARGANLVRRRVERMPGRQTLPDVSLFYLATNATHFTLLPNRCLHLQSLVLASFGPLVDIRTDFSLRLEPKFVQGFRVSGPQFFCIFIFFRSFVFCGFQGSRSGFKFKGFGFRVSFAVTQGTGFICSRFAREVRAKNHKKRKTIKIMKKRRTRDKGQSNLNRSLRRAPRQGPLELPHRHSPNQCGGPDLVASAVGSSQRIREAANWASWADCLEMVSERHRQSPRP